MLQPMISMRIIRSESIDGQLVLLSESCICARCYQLALPQFLRHCFSE